VSTKINPVMNGNAPSLRAAFRIQTRVISALMMREVITRYGRHNVGFLWLFIEPMLFTLGVTTLWTLIKATHGTSLPITAFAVTGYSSILLWRNCSNRVVKAIEANSSLMYHRNVRVFDIFMARLFLEIAGATISMVTLTIAFASIGWMNYPEDIITVAMGWFLLSWFSIALSLIVGAASERSEFVERVWHICTYLLFPASGAGFMVDWLPKGAQDIVLLMPMVHGTEMIRHGYFGSAVRTYEDPVYFVIINSIMLLMGLALVRETGRRVEPE
jgi:capsular polysaccharide transport system permease protein